MTIADPFAVTVDLDRVAAYYRALSHPLRVRILLEFDPHARLSPIQLAGRFEESLGTVSYHVRELHAVGLLQAAGAIQRRGALQHFYRLSDKGRSLREEARRIGRA